MLTAGVLSKRIGGLAGWVASWGEAPGGVNPFTDLNNFEVVTGPDGNITDASKLQLRNFRGVKEQPISLGDLKIALGSKNAERVLSVLLKRQQAQQRQRTQQT